LPGISGDEIKNHITIHYVVKLIL